MANLTYVCAMTMQIDDDQSGFDEVGDLDVITTLTAERIAALMWRHGLSVSSLARRIRKGRVTTSTKMNGHARWYADELVRIATVLDTTVGYLLGETDDDQRPAHLKKCPHQDSNLGPAD